MLRRKLLIACATSSLAAASSQAQLSGAKAQHIGVLSPFNAASDRFRDAIQQRLGELGYAPGRNVVIEYRTSNDRVDRLPQLAAELVARPVDVIVTTTAAGVQAAKQATASIPIVMAGVDDAVSQGFVASLATPGGNVTGTSWLNTELSAKRVQLLKQMLPAVSRVAFLREAAGAARSLQAVDAAARALNMQLVIIEFRGPDEIGGAISALVLDRVGAVIVAEGPMLHGQEPHVVELATRHHLPTMFSFREAVEAGALMSYGPKPLDLYRRAADYVVRILKGDKPATLPVEQPTTFELVINLRTAAALGINVPQAMLVSADVVIR